MLVIKRLYKLIIIVLVFGCAPLYKTPTTFFDSLNGLRFTEIKSEPGFERSFLVWIEQPLDHSQPESGTFWQRLWVSHRSVTAPTVLVTEGYWAVANYITELSEILNANQIIVEHRFFGQSVPDSIQWKYLTIEQAANDHHRITKLFKKLYKSSWVNTGVSKGGQTALIHRAFFPDDVNVTVTYVAPFNLEREDKRLISFFDEVGTDEMRQRIKNFQITLLKRRDEILPLFSQYVKEYNFTFSTDLDKAFELCVLEYPFSLLQWCSSYTEIPHEGDTPQLIFAHFQKSIDFGYFSDQETKRFAPFFYQAYTELGYYGYLAKPLLPYMKSIKCDTVSSDFMVPKGVTTIFNKERPFQITRMLQKNDPRVIHLVGKKDPWSSTSIDTESFTNSIKIVDPDGCHFTRIYSMPDSLKNKTLELLNRWIIKN